MTGWDEIQDLHSVILAMSGPITQCLNGIFLPFDPRTDEELWCAQAIWRGVFESNSVIEFDTLPRVPLTAQIFSLIRSRQMYERCEEYFNHFEYSEYLNQYYEKVPTDYRSPAQIECYGFSSWADSICPIRISYLLAAAMENVWLDELQYKLHYPVALACAAVVGGHIALLKFLVAEYGVDIKRLRYVQTADVGIRKNSACLSPNRVYGFVMDIAAGSGHLSMLKYLHEAGSTALTSWAMDAAALGGHLDCVRYLHEVCHAPCTTNAMDAAAGNGHLDIVKFLHENRSEGCSRDAMDAAVYYGHLNIVKYLHHHRTEGGTYEALQFASNLKNKKILNYLEANFIKVGQALLPTNQGIDEYIIEEEATPSYDYFTILKQLERTSLMCA